MPTIDAPTTIVLTSAQSEQVKKLIDDGRYPSPEAVVARSLALLDQELTGESVYSNSAQARIREGIDASLRGETVPQEEIEAFFKDWKREIHA